MFANETSVPFNKQAWNIGYQCLSKKQGKAIYVRRHAQSRHIRLLKRFFHMQSTAYVFFYLCVLSRSSKYLFNSMLPL